MCASRYASCKPAKSNVIVAGSPSSRNLTVRLVNMMFLVDGSEEDASSSCRLYLLGLSSVILTKALDDHQGLDSNLAASPWASILAGARPPPK